MNKNMEKKGLKSFKDLIVWQKAADLATLIYKITEDFPKSEFYGLTNQIRKAAISISSNLAEGFKRTHKKEKIQFFNVAYGSAAELESQVEISYRLDFLSDDNYQKLNTSIIEICKMIDCLIKSTKKSPTKSYILNSIFLLIFLSLLFAYPSFAKTNFYFEGSQPDKNSLEFIVWVKVDSDKPVNAYDILLKFPENLIRFKRYDTNISIVDVWKKIDLVSQNEIALQGGSIKPFKGESGQIIALIFEATKPGSDNFVFEKAFAYLADGKGSLADDVYIQNVPLSISQVAIEEKHEVGLLVVSSTTPLIKNDTIAPEIVNFKITENPFDSKQTLLIFETKDNSGMVKNFVRVKKWLTWSPFYEVQNPYGFSKNIWALQFLAVDNSNNLTQKTVYFWQILAGKLIFCLLLMVAVGIIIKILYNKLKRKNAQK
ncbi:MAG: four helix bundle protein [Minisyncoccia bacterium]